MLIIDIDEELRLEKLDQTHARDIFDLINQNREYLRKWLTFVDSTQCLEDTESYITFIDEASVNPNSELVVAIIYKSRLVGMAGFKRVDWANRIAEIGYWLAEPFQGHGIISRTCTAIIQYAFETAGANRVEIKCGVGNEKSSRVPQRLGFSFEGVERDGELVNGHYINIEVYSLLKREWIMNRRFMQVQAADENVIENQVILRQLSKVN
jgi:ribosomal-protein-serine acetyltransferase